ACLTVDATSNVQPLAADAGAGRTKRRRYAKRSPHLSGVTGVLRCWRRDARLLRGARLSIAATRHPTADPSGSVAATETNMATGRAAIGIGRRQTEEASPGGSGRIGDGLRTSSGSNHPARAAAGIRPTV